jgi:hypothetical protein
MNLKIFDNRSGYRPSSSLKEWWLLMPQNDTTVQGIESFDGEKVPPVFGEPKNVAIHFVLVGILILSEMMLILQLEDNGVDFNILMILSAIDFVIAILPVLIIKFLFKITPAEINARIFIEKVKRFFNEKDGLISDNERNNRRAVYQYQIEDYEGRLRKFRWLNIFSLVVILAFSFWKFISFYEVLGHYIFLIPIGRFIMSILVLSIITHLISTKIVFVSVFFYNTLRKELKARKKDLGLYSIPPSEKNKPKEITGFPGNYKASIALNQRIAQQVAYKTEEGKDHSDVLLLKWGDDSRYYRTQHFTEDKGICIIYSGLLTDPELEGLSTTQDAGEKLAVLATGKDIQLSQ